MFIHNRILAAVMVLANPVTATAMEWTNTITVGAGFGTLSGGGGDVTTYSLDFSGAADFGNGLHVNYDLGFIGADFPTLGFNADTLSGMIAPRYQFSEVPVSVGAYVDYGELGISGLGSNLSATSYGATLGYEAETWRATAFLGTTDTDPALPAGTSVTDFGLMIGVEASDRMSFAANAVRSQINSGGTSVDIDIVEVGGTYQVTNNIDLFAGISRASAIGILDISTYGLGASYFFGDMVGIPLTASVEVARSELDVIVPLVTMDTVRFGLTMPIGKGGAKLPLNSLAGAIQNGRHSAATQSILSAF